MSEAARRSPAIAETRIVTDRTDLGAAWQRDLLQSIPLAQAMQLRLAAYDGHSLSLSAPLAPNINDKGCAFGGSLSSVLTLAGWGLIVLRLVESGLDCDVYVQDSSVRYLAPVWHDFSAEARLADGENWSSFVQTLAQRGRARLATRSRIGGDDGGDTATLEARFVAMRREPKSA